MLSRADVLAVLASREAQWDFERERPAADTPRLLAHRYLETSSGFDFLAETLRDLPDDLPPDIVSAQHHPVWMMAMDLAVDALMEIRPYWRPTPPAVPAMPNPVGTWEEYFDSMRDKPVHPLYRDLAPHLRPRGRALELAAGMGQGARFLLESGQTVWANDVHGAALDHLYRAAPRDLLHALHLRVLGFERLDLVPGYFDLVSAGFCLFFMSREQLAEKWPILVGSLRPGGMFAGQFLGVRDDWASQGYTAHDRPDVEAHLAPFDLLYWKEVERDGKTSQGYEKHWHVFHVIARIREGHEPAGAEVASPYR